MAVRTTNNRWLFNDDSLVKPIARVACKVFLKQSGHALAFWS